MPSGDHVDGMVRSTLCLLSSCSARRQATGLFLPAVPARPLAPPALLLLPRTPVTHLPLQKPPHRRQPSPSTGAQCTVVADSLCSTPPACPASVALLPCTSGPPLALSRRLKGPRSAPRPAKASTAPPWRLAASGISLRLFKPWPEPSLLTTRLLLHSIDPRRQEPEPGRPSSPTPANHLAARPSPPPAHSGRPQPRIGPPSSS